MLVHIWGTYTIDATLGFDARSYHNLLVSTIWSSNHVFRLCWKAHCSRVQLCALSCGWAHDLSTYIVVLDFFGTQIFRLAAIRVCECLMAAMVQASGRRWASGRRLQRCMRPMMRCRACMSSWQQLSVTVITISSTAGTRTPVGAVNDICAMLA